MYCNYRELWVDERYVLAEKPTPPPLGSTPASVKHNLSFSFRESPPSPPSLEPYLRHTLELIRLSGAHQLGLSGPLSSSVASFQPPFPQKLRTAHRSAAL